MLEAGLSHDVSGGGFGWYFLPSWDCWGLWQLQIRPRQGVSSGGGNNDDEAQGVRLERVSACKGKIETWEADARVRTVAEKKKGTTKEDGTEEIGSL